MKGKKEKLLMILFRHAKATGSESKASSQWEFDFELGKPAKLQRNYKWEAMPCDEVPKVYRLNHIKRLYSVTQNKNFEGQLPKLRYYHHIKKVEPQEENNNNKAVSVMEQPITASSKKNGSNGQMKITGEKGLFCGRSRRWRFYFFGRFPQREEATHGDDKEKTVSWWFGGLVLIAFAADTHSKIAFKLFLTHHSHVQSIIIIFSR